MKTLPICFAFLFFLSHPAQGYDKLADFLYPEYTVTIKQLPALSFRETRSVASLIDLPGDSADRHKDTLDFIKKKIQDNNEEAAAVFSKYDFSGDGIDDLIMSDYFGSGEIQTFLWIKSGSKYDFAGAFDGKPQFFRSDATSSSSLLTRSGWCCPSRVGKIYLYELQKVNGKRRYALIKKIMEMSHIRVPVKKYAPIRFTTIDDQDRLRSSPEVRDDYDPDMSGLHNKPTYGNIIAEIEKGSKGEAVASHTDKTGRVWWFVVMDKDAPATYSLFYDDEDGCKTGWMISRHLKIMQ